MARTLRTAAAAAITFAAAWTAWGLYAKASTERVGYTTLRTLDGVEIRRYPSTVLAETTADGEREAFGRLFRYIQGANEADAELAMTAPVRTRPRRIEMTAPVRTTETDEGVTMGFYLPQEVASTSPPTPTDPEVTLAVEEPRTLAVRPFGWYATPARIENYEWDLLDTLAERGLQPAGDPFLLRYDAPYTPPFMRRNEIAVEL
ncbi:SOUL family heme-binding protein [Salinilacihabitans rarus]|uniref:SOUL family heme-binding protein n=1 Tax=Salinilacihabitans rarus TaxID=2961596 RepID=UPI0020C91E3D|nr:heme-binding protein [Salinilacihabitans rarus]